MGTTSAPFDMETVGRRFAPLVRFHPEEGYFPSTVPWFLKQAELWHRASPMHANRPTTLIRVLQKGQVNPTSLISQRVKRDRSDTSPHANIRPGSRGTFCLNVPDNTNAIKTYVGNLRTAKCYVHLQPGLRVGRWWLAYLFFYPYNGSISPIISSAHEGDWEHIRVEVDNQGSKVHRIYMAAHEGGSWYRRYSTNDPQRVGYRHYNRTDHPIVYSARHSHATYATASVVKRRLLGNDKLMPDDLTGRGKEWKTWNHLEVLGDWANPLPGQKWLKFSGRWGQLWGFFHGPTGPAFKDWWKDNGL